MPFSPEEQERLRTVKGVGPKVIERLEQLGFSSLEELAAADVAEITQMISQELGSTCWRNSPQARAAIEGAIQLARESVASKGG